MKKDLLNSLHITQEEYSEAKKLIGFTPMAFIWNGDIKKHINLKIRNTQKNEN